jgi:ABC-type transporter Mla subunit MlaD
MAVPRTRNLVRTGGIVTAMLILAGVLTARLPATLAPASHSYNIEAPIIYGADGISVGSKVLLGGIPLGVVESVVPVLDEASNTPQAHALHFSLDARYPLYADANIRKEAAITGAGGTLYIADLGSPTHPISVEDPLALEEGSTGMATAFGPRAASSISSLRVSVAHATPAISAMSEEFRSSTEEISATLDGLRPISPNPEMLREDWGAVKKETELLVSQKVIAAHVERLQDRFQILKERAKAIEFAIDERRKTIDHTIVTAKESVAAAETIIARVKQIAPESIASLQRAKAQTTLAGGQLSRLTSAILSEGVRALTVVPNKASWSERQLLESVEDVLLASTSLKQTTMLLEALAKNHPDAATTNAALEQSLRLLNAHLSTLFDLLTSEMP